MATASLQATSKVRRLARTGKARTIREVANVSLSRAAREIGVSKSPLCRWELGERLPREGPAAERWLALLVLLSEIGLDAEERA